MSSTIVVDTYLNTNTLYIQGQFNYKTITYHNTAQAPSTVVLPQPLPGFVILKTDFYETQTVVLPLPNAMLVGASVRILKTLVPAMPWSGLYADHWPAILSVQSGGWIIPFGDMLPLYNNYSFPDTKYYVEAICDGQYWKIANMT
jgi:hypothetical protein